MPKYKSRAGLIGKVQNIKKQVNLAAKIKKSAPKNIKEFIRAHPEDSINIAKQIIQHAKQGVKGGGFAKKAVSAIGLVGVGAAAGALGFRQWLIQNPAEASKLAGTAITTGVKAFLLGGNFGGNISSGGNLKTGGNISSGGLLQLLKPGAPQAVKRFVKSKPMEALQIAKMIHDEAKKMKGGGFGSKVVKAVALPVIAGAATGIGLGFRDYLRDNPEQVLTFAGVAADALKGALTGGSLIDPSKIIKATQKVQSAIGRGGQKLANVARKIEAADIDAIDHKIMGHIISHATPHEFNLVRGIASKMLKIPHPMDDYISRHIKGGSLDIPKKLHKEALRDILRAPSPHFLAEMLHTERMDKERGMDVGGGLLDVIKHIGSKSLGGVKSFGKGAVSVGRSMNNLLLKGILIAQLLEPLIVAAKPGAKLPLKTGIALATDIQKGLGTTLTINDAVNSVLHGDTEKTIELLEDLGAGKESKRIAKDLENIEKRGVEEAEENIQDILEKEQKIIQQKAGN